jgi:plasmid stabilization system protein ParE
VTILFLTEARSELVATSEYYQEQVVGLGEDFLDEVETVLNMIQLHPESGTTITATKRRFLLSRFPYGIIYSVDVNVITIFAVMHLRRKPGYWSPRK